VKRAARKDRLAKIRPPQCNGRARRLEYKSRGESDGCHRQSQGPSCPLDQSGRLQLAFHPIEPRRPMQIRGPGNTPLRSAYLDFRGTFERRGPPAQGAAPIGRHRLLSVTRVSCLSSGAPLPRRRERDRVSQAPTPVAEAYGRCTPLYKRLSDNPQVRAFSVRPGSVLRPWPPFMDYRPSASRCAYAGRYLDAGIVERFAFQRMLAATFCTRPLTSGSRSLEQPHNSLCAKPYSPLLC
jgi:hypothetical protein